MTEHKTLVVWRFIDGKLGHEKQTQALIEGLEHWHKPIKTINIAVGELKQTWPALITGSWPELSQLPTPDLAIGAGRLCHWPLIASKRAFGNRICIIQKSALPDKLFDCIITPIHDGQTSDIRHIVIPTSIAAAVESKPNAQQGLLLVGGPSNHFTWHDDQVISAITRVLNQFPEVHWQISSSRRTAEATCQLLEQTQLNNTRVDFHRVESLPRSWLGEQLKTAGQIWVTADSASMISEALNTRAAVGIIQLPHKGKANNKLQRLARLLLDRGLIGEASEQGFIEGPVRHRPENYQLDAAKQLLEKL